MEGVGMPWEFELDRIMTLVERGDKARLEEAMHDFFCTTIRELRSAKPEVIPLYLTELVTCALHEARMRQLPGEEVRQTRNEAYDVLLSTREPEMLENKLTDLLCRLVDRIEAAGIAGYSQPVSHALQAISLRFRDKSFCLQELAHSMGVNGEYLGRLFKKETGETFSVALSRMRVQEAEKLLYRTDRHAAQIAEDVGFSDARYFYRVFRQVTGVRPGEVREQKK